MNTKIILPTILFLLFNFGALAAGGFFTGVGVPSDWYVNLNKAPWTPPGWVFGASWTFIMICYSIYMGFLWVSKNNRSKLVGLYIFQLILNIGWNPVFFYFHNALFGLVIIVLLTLLIGYFLFTYLKLLRLKTILILPYFIWLLIATSLNAYVVFYN